MNRRLDPADLRAYARRDWGIAERLDRVARARAPVDEKLALAGALYQAARVTRPSWPTDADRLIDFESHIRMRDIFRRAGRVGAR